MACVVLNSGHSDPISCIRSEGRHQFQDSNDRYGLFAGATHETDDKEAEKATRPNHGCALVRPAHASEEAEVVEHCTERTKIQQQFADLKRWLAAVTDSEWGDTQRRLDLDLTIYPNSR